MILKKIFAGVLMFSAGTMLITAKEPLSTNNSVLQVPGTLSGFHTVTPAASEVSVAKIKAGGSDIDLKAMAGWAMNYLISTPRAEFGYEPVFQCHPLQCPPAPSGQDVVVACDTDARMDWEWYYMREISGVRSGLDVERAFHKRMREYIDPRGRVWSHPGCFNEGDINKRYSKDDEVIHIWGATKILKSLSEDYARTHDRSSLKLAKQVMQALKRLATWDAEGRCWITCGMGAYRADGTIVPNGWNSHPAPIVEPLVTYWLATGDEEGLKFARAYTEGVIHNLQPGGLKFQPDGSFNGHSHATLHGVWGIAHLGLVDKEPRYVDFARRTFEWMLTRSTGTGWFPAAPDSCNETCCISDMISIAAILGEAGHPEYYDCVERYLRNYISPLQFIVTPDFERRYRASHAKLEPEKVEAGLKELHKFQGGVIGGSGLNDFENQLLGGVSGYEMFGCCAPEGMRAIYTSWSNTISKREKTKDLPAGIFVNLNLSRDSEWGRVYSGLPSEGRLSVAASKKDNYFLRPPHWAPKQEVKGFVGEKQQPVVWVGDYIQFKARRGELLTITYPLIGFEHERTGIWKQTAPNLKMQFTWVGNKVVSSSPAAATNATPLFGTTARVLPPLPASIAGK